MENFEEIEQEETFLSQSSPKRKHIFIAVVVVIVVIGGGLVFYFQSQSTDLKGTLQTTRDGVREHLLDLNLTSTLLTLLPEGRSGALAQVVFSSDGRHVAFTDGVLGEERIFIDDQPGKTFQGLRRPSWNKQGTHIVYEACEGEKDLIIIQSIEGELQEIEVGKPLGMSSYGACSTMSLNPIWSSDGQKVGYVKDIEDKQSVVVRDIKKKTDREYGAYDSVSSISFSDDSVDVISVIRQDKKMLIVRNEEKGKEYNKAIFGEPLVKSASQSMFYRVLADIKGMFVLAGREESKVYDEIRDFVLEPGGEYVAYIAIEEDKFFVVVGNEEKKRYDEVLDLSFSPSGKVLYTARENGKWHIVLGDTEVYTYNHRVENPIVSSDGQIVVARGGTDSIGDQFLVIGQNREKSYTWIRNLRIDVGSSHIAYTAQLPEKSGAMIVLDGKEGKIYEGIYTPPIFSANGEQLAYGVEDGNELWWVVEEVN